MTAKPLLYIYISFNHILIWRNLQRRSFVYYTPVVSRCMPAIPTMGPFIFLTLAAAMGLGNILCSILHKNNLALAGISPPHTPSKLKHLHSLKLLPILAPPPIPSPLQHSKHFSNCKMTSYHNAKRAYLPGDKSSTGFSKFHPHPSPKKMELWDIPACCTILKNKLTDL